MLREGEALKVWAPLRQTLRIGLHVKWRRMWGLMWLDDYKKAFGSLLLVHRVRHLKCSGSHFIQHD